MSVTASVAFPPNAKGSIMPDTDFSLDHSPSALERPPCPKCEGQMIFNGMVLGPPGFDIRTFGCIVCDYAEKVVIGTNIMGWINSRGLRPPS
jgi:hypothetical protein